MALISNGDQVLTKRVYNSDETVLWEGEAVELGDVISCSESIKNFERIRIYCMCVNDNTTIKTHLEDVDTSKLVSRISIGGRYVVNNGFWVEYALLLNIISDTSMSIFKSQRAWGNSGYGTGFSDAASPENGLIYKVVGINSKSTSEDN